MFHRVIEPAGELALLEQHHAEALFALVDHNREHLRPWMGWVDSTQSVDDIRSFVGAGLTRFAARNGWETGIWHRGKLVGVLGVHAIDWTHWKSSLGYWIDKEHQGHGLVTNACRAVLDHCFGPLGLNRMMIWCGTSNRRSRAIPERLGFSHEGTHRQGEWLYDHFVDLEIYSMLRKDWAQQKVAGRDPNI